MQLAAILNILRVFSGIQKTEVRQSYKNSEEHHGRAGQRGFVGTVVLDTATGTTTYHNAVTHDGIPFS